MKETERVKVKHHMLFWFSRKMIHHHNNTVKVAVHGMIRMLTVYTVMRLRMIISYLHLTRTQRYQPRYNIQTITTVVFAHDGGTG
jgi:hypothetical protein